MTDDPQQRGAPGPGVPPVPEGSAAQPSPAVPAAADSPGAPPDAPGVHHAGEGLYHLVLGQVTSALVVSFRSTRVFTGTVDQLRASYRQVLIHNLLLGWWGFPFGLVWTPMWLWRNRKSLAKLRSLSDASAAPRA